MKKLPLKFLAVSSVLLFSFGCTANIAKNRGRAIARTAEINYERALAVAIPASNNEEYVRKSFKRLDQEIDKADPETIDIKSIKEWFMGLTEKEVRKELGQNPDSEIEKHLRGEKRLLFVIRDPGKVSGFFKRQFWPIINRRATYILLVLKQGIVVDVDLDTSKTRTVQIPEAIGFGLTAVKTFK